MEDRTFENYAFISYKREDKKWAKWLQQRLEDYTLPSDIREEYEDTPENLRPIFRDETDLSGPFLKSSLNSALDESKYLIVICSPNSAKSEWVNKEVEHFITNRDIRYVIPFIVDGTPNANDLQLECFPPAIRNLPSDKELLGISVEESGKEPALVKTVSRITNIKYDTLWRRYHKSQTRRKNISLTLLLLIAAIMTALVVTTTKQNILIKKKNNDLFISQSIAVADAANRVLADGDAFTAAKLALEVLPSDISNPDRPYTPQAELALRNAVSAYTGHFYGQMNEGSFIHLSKMSQDGKLLIAASNDADINIWDATNGNLLKTSNCNEGWINGIDISPNNKTFITYGQSDTIRVWNINDAKCIQTIDCSSIGNLMGARFTEDNNRIISSIDNYIVEWDITSGNHKIIRDDIPMVNTDKALAEIGKKYIVVREGYYQYFVYDLENNRKVLTEFINDYDIVKISQDEQIATIIFTNYYKTHSHIRIYDIANNRLIREIRRDESITLEDISLNNQNILTITYKTNNNYTTYHSIDIWHIASGKKIKSFDGSSIISASFSPDGKRIMAFPANDYILSWNSEVNTSISIGRPDVLLNHHGDKLAIDTHKTIDIFDTNKHRVIKRFDFQNNEKPSYIRKLYFSRDDRYLLCPMSTSTFSIDYLSINKTSLIVCDILNGTYREIEYDFPIANTLNYENSYFQTTPDNKYIIATTNPEYQTYVSQYDWGFDLPEMTELAECHAIYINDFKTGEQLHSLTGHTDKIIDTYISKDNKQVISVSKDGSIRFWDIKTGECTKTVQDSSGGFILSNISKDKKYIYTLNNNQIVSRLNLKSGKQLDICTMEVSNYHKLDISNSNKFLMFVNFDYIWLISADTGKVLHKIETHLATHGAAYLSHDDQYIVVESSNGEILVYSTNNGSLIWQLHDKGNSIQLHPTKNEFIHIGTDIVTEKIVSLQQLINETKQRLSHRKFTQEERQKYYLQ